MRQAWPTSIIPDHSSELSCHARTPASARSHSAALRDRSGGGGTAAALPPRNHVR